VRATDWRIKIRRTMNESDSDANTKAVDSLLNYETVKYFNNEEFEASRYDESLQRWETAAVRSQTSLSLLNIGQSAIIAIAVTLIVWRATLGVVDGTMTIGDLVGKKIGVNGTNSIGTLLISVLLAEHGISPKKVHFITDGKGFPAMPGQLDHGAWSAAFLAQPYVTIAGEAYGEQVLADLDQGATTDFAIDGYVATQAWVKKYPGTAAAFVRAIEEGQALANNEPRVVQTAMAKSDNLSLQVTALISLPGFPTGPVDEERIQREANLMLQFGVLGTEYAKEVGQGTLVSSMVGPVP